MASSAITGPVFSDNKRAPAGTAAAPSFAFNDSTGTGVYLVSPGVLGLSTAGVQAGSVNASGAWTLGGAAFTGSHVINGGIAIGAGSGGKIAYNDLTSGAATNLSGTHVKDSNINVPSGFWMLTIEYFFATTTESQVGYAIAWGTGSSVTVNFVSKGIAYTGTASVTISGGKYRLQIAGASGTPSSGAIVFRVYQ